MNDTRRVLINFNKTLDPHNISYRPQQVKLSRHSEEAHMKNRVKSQIRRIMIEKSRSK
jgi:hypothetical protein